MSIPVINQVAAYYSGTLHAKTCDITVSQGIEPSRATITFLPQDVSLIPRNGNLLIQGKNQVLLLDMWVDNSTIKRSESGQVVGLQLMDRRWKWRFGTISYTANMPFKSGKRALQANRVNARVIATKLAVAMNEPVYDFSLIPLTDYPPVYYKEENPASELVKLVSSYGLEIHRDPLTGVLTAIRPGFSLSFPNFPQEDVKFASSGIEFTEGPSTIRVVGDDVRFEAFLSLQAIGYEPSSGEWKAIDDLDYKPSGGWEYESPTNLIPSDPDINNRIWANNTVFKTYRANGFSNNGVPASTSIPGWNGTQPANINEILPLDKYLLSTTINQAGQEVRSPPYIRGIFKKNQDTLENVVSVNSLSGELLEGDFKINNEEGVVNFPYPVYRVDTTTRKLKPATLWMKASFRLHVGGYGSEYYFYDMPTNIVGGAGVEPLEMNELDRNIIAAYPSDDPAGGHVSNDNVLEVDTIAIAIANIKKSQYTDVASYSVRLRHIQPLSTDGIVRQVRWQVSEQGAFTTLYMNNESSVAALTGHQKRRAAGAFDNYLTSKQNRLSAGKRASSSKK